MSVPIHKQEGTLSLVKSYLAKGKIVCERKTSSQVLLKLFGSWNDSRSTEEIIKKIRKGRKSSRKLEKGFEKVLTGHRHNNL